MVFSEVLDLDFNFPFSKYSSFSVILAEFLPEFSDSICFEKFFFTYSKSSVLELKIMVESTIFTEDLSELSCSVLVSVLVDDYSCFFSESVFLELSIFFFWLRQLTKNKIIKNGRTNHQLNFLIRFFIVLIF